MDIVLGVNLRGNFHIFEPSFMSAKKALNALKKVLLLNKAATLWHQLFQALEQTNFLPYYSDYAGAEDFGKHPGIFSVLGRSLDLAIEAVKHDKHLEEQNYYCDILLRPNIPSVSPADFTQKKELYEIGRKAGWEAVRKLEAEVLVRSRAAVQEKEVVF
jgi:predicted acylesterase/phospholipase RssA